MKNKKWFLTAALSGTVSESRADKVFSAENIDKKHFSNIDVFFVVDEKEKELIAKKTPPHIMIANINDSEEEIEHNLLMFPGRDFVSRIGHDIINLISPLIDYQYLSDDMIKKRIEKSSILGQQINMIGHLLQKDFNIREKSELIDFTSTLKDLSRKSGLDVEIYENGESSSFEMPSEKILYSVVKEIVSNIKLHSAGENRVFIEKDEKTIVISNKTNYEFNFENIKAVLRRPFYKQGNTNGNGLGLFIISLSSVIGGFKWHICVENSYFYLYLFF